MKVKDRMTETVELVTPTDSVNSAAQKMAKSNLGFLPVADQDRLVGILTDRDIVTRCVADNHDIKKMKIEQAMSKKVFYCYEDDSLEEAADSMIKQHVRRLPVLNNAKRLVGIISLGDIAQAAPVLSGETLRQVAVAH